MLSRHMHACKNVSPDHETHGFDLPSIQVLRACISVIRAQYEHAHPWLLEVKPYLRHSLCTTALSWLLRPGGKGSSAKTTVGVAWPGLLKGLMMFICTLGCYNQQEVHCITSSIDASPIIPFYQINPKQGILTCIIRSLEGLKLIGDANSVLLRHRPHAWGHAIRMPAPSPALVLSPVQPW